MDELLKVYYASTNKDDKEDLKTKRKKFQEFEEDITLLLMHLISNVSLNKSLSDLRYSDVHKTREGNVRFNYQRNAPTFQGYLITHKNQPLCEVSLPPKGQITICSKPNHEVGYGSWDYAAKVLQKVCYHRFSEMRITHER